MALRLAEQGSDIILTYNSKEGQAAGAAKEIEAKDGGRRSCGGSPADLPQLRTLRQIMEQVYRLFDRRCRSETALEKLARLRRRVQRFKRVGKTLQRAVQSQPGEGPHVAG